MSPSKRPANGKGPEPAPAPRDHSAPIVIGGQAVHLGETRDINIPFSENYLGGSVSFPVRVIRAAEPGPAIFFTGAVHGDELTGVGIIREFLFSELPPLVRGSVICAPAVNTFGLETQSRYLPDRKDLNRCFPGAADGSMSSRLAFEITRQIIQNSDYGLDFHSAAVRRVNYPNVRADLTDPRARALAEAFGCELIVSSKGPEGSLRRTACEAGVPTIILEAGEVWKIEPGVVQIGIRGCVNVLRSLGMVEGERLEPIFRATIEKTTWVRASRGGFLGFHSNPGDLIRKGQPLATNYSIFGRERSDLVAPENGLILGMATMPAVKPGEPVYHLAILDDDEYRRIRQAIASSPDHGLFQRLRDDFSTNVHNPSADYNEVISAAPEPEDPPSLETQYGED
ncbi:MAG: succinylglutamate desuccinylase/aspartoacylase family protein [Sumerlaeia bacterium]